MAHSTSRMLSAAEIIAGSWPAVLRPDPERDIRRIQAMLRNPNLAYDQRADLQRKLNEYLAMAVRPPH